jgi:hypothetical protein
MPVYADPRDVAWKEYLRQQDMTEGHVAAYPPSPKSLFDAGWNARVSADEYVELQRDVHATDAAIKEITNRVAEWFKALDVDQEKQEQTDEFLLNMIHDEALDLLEKYHGDYVPEPEGT